MRGLIQNQSLASIAATSGSRRRACVLLLSRGGVHATFSSIVVFYCAFPYTGAIPKEIGKLAKMKRLRIAENALVGEGGEDGDAQKPAF